MPQETAHKKGRMMTSKQFLEEQKDELRLQRQIETPKRRKNY